jgi:hypothetical protein
MTKERITLSPSIRHRELRPLTRFASEDLLDRVGLPIDPSFVHGRSENTHGAALYVGERKLKPNGIFNGGYPVIVCELENNKWHLLGIEKKPKKDSESFCNDTLQAVDKSTSFTPYILEHFSKTAERKRNFAGTIYQRVFSRSE